MNELDEKFAALPEAFRLKLQTEGARRRHAHRRGHIAAAHPNPQPVGVEVLAEAETPAHAVVDRVAALCEHDPEAVILFARSHGLSDADLLVVLGGEDFDDEPKKP